VNGFRRGRLVMAFVGIDRNPDCSAEGPAQDGAITTADLIADCRTGGTPDATSDCRIQCRVASVGFNS